MVGVARTQVCSMERWRHVSLLHVAAVLTASLQAALLLLSLIMICLAYTELKLMYTHTLAHTSRLRQQLVTPQRLVTVCTAFPLPPSPTQVSLWQM